MVSAASMSASVAQTGGSCGPSQCRVVEECLGPRHVQYWSARLRLIREVEPVLTIRRFITSVADLRFQLPA